MKIIIVRFSFILCLAMVPQACDQPQNKTGQSKNVVASYSSNWVPRSIKQLQNENSWMALPSARITVNQQKQNRNKLGVENIVFKSIDGGQTWQDVSEGLPDNFLWDGFITTNSGVYIRVGDGIYHSNPNSTGPFWIKEICPNNFSGIAPGKRGLFAYNYGGQFFQQEEGTKGWSPMYMNFQENLVRTLFESTGGIVFIGCDNGLFKSINNGKTWKQVHTGGWVMKLVESNGILLATNQQGIIRSTDDGENWDLVISEGGVGISVESINGGFAAITYNTESKTRRVRASFDNGKNWLSIDGGLPADANISSIIQFGDYLFCGHPMGIFRSSDMGKTWKLLLPAVGNKVFNLSVSGKIIYAIPRNRGC